MKKKKLDKTQLSDSVYTTHCQVIFFLGQHSLWSDTAVSLNSINRQASVCCVFNWLHKGSSPMRTGTCRKYPYLTAFVQSAAGSLVFRTAEFCSGAPRSWWILEASFFAQYNKQAVTSFTSSSILFHILYRFTRHL